MTRDAHAPHKTCSWTDRRFSHLRSPSYRERSRNYCPRRSISHDEIDWFIYHQANQYMLEQLAKRCKVPQEKMVIDVHDIGNTVSASIPIAIERSVEAGKILPGQRMLLVGFGVGYSWAACDLTWNGDN